jgi:hypothetical protein
VKPDPFSRPAAKCDEPGFDQPLKIQRRLVSIFQLISPPWAPHDDDLIQARHEIKNFFSFRLDGPGDFRVRKMIAQSGEGRKRVNDIAQRAEPDDEEILHELPIGRPAPTFRFSQDPGNDFGRGPDFRASCNGDLAAVSADGLPFGNGFFSIVRAFGVDIRFQGEQDLFYGRIFKNREIIDTIERRKNVRSLAFPKNRPSSALEAADRGIAVECHYKDIAPLFRLFQIPNMAGMDQVKTSVGQNDRPPIFSFKGNDSLQLGQCFEFVQFPETTACLSTRGVRVAVPFFMTTIPPAQLARRAAC